MKFELKHLAPYLDHRLKIQGQTHGEIQELSGLREGIVYTIEGNKLYGWTDIFNIKPILRPLSDLTKEIEVNGERFVPVRILMCAAYKAYDSNYDLLFATQEPTRMPYHIVQKLYEWHFDVFGLIPNNLAIDMNTIKQSVTT